MATSFLSDTSAVCATVGKLLNEKPPLLVEVHEKPAGKLSRHPALLLTVENGESSPRVFMPAGVPGRALSIRFYDAEGQSLPNMSLAMCIGHGGDSEHWTVAVVR